MEERSEHMWAVDGIEEGVARVEEDGDRMLTIPLHLLPAGVKEGQLLHVTRTSSADQGSVHLSIAVDWEATDTAVRDSKAQTTEMLSESRKRDHGGDVSL
jgi:hypothetical protein